MGRIGAEAESRDGQPACLGLMNWLIHSPLICLVVALMRFHALIEAIAITSPASCDSVKYWSRARRRG